jgi:transcriptional regulator with XRE-family HTH domain
MEKQTLGEFIRTWMERRGVKPRDLANLLRRSESYISMLVNDRVKIPPPDVVDGLAKALDVSEIQLLQKVGYLSDSKAAEASPQNERLEELVSVTRGMTDEQLRWLVAYADFLMEQTS